jgi:hypothetical protein
MRKLVYISVFMFMIINGMYAQVSKFKIRDEVFVEPTLDAISFLFSNIDSVKWNDALLPLHFKSIPAAKKVTALEYKKESDGVSEYIGFDDRYGVLTFIWRDELGKNMISKNLKKTLKKKEYNSSGTYKIQYNGFNFVISIETTKDKAINEMITVEQERK